MAQPRPELRLDTPVQYLKGVGPVRARQLERLGIRQAGDLLHHYPADYLEQGELLPLAQVRAGRARTTRGRLLDVHARRLRNRRSLLVAMLGDGPARLRLSWFNAPWLKERLRVGQELVVSGEVSVYAGQLQMVNPRFEEAEESSELASGRPLPRYALSAGLKQGPVRELVQRAVAELADREPDPFPEDWRREDGLLPHAEALRVVHRPASLQEAERGRLRLAYEEALALQLAVGIRRARLLRRRAGVRLGEFGDRSRRLVEGLGFPLTGAQRRVLAAIAQDLRGEYAMHRLLQGDVGSGKTLVAVIAMLWMAEAGAQAAFMAPTEVLARQHGLRQTPLLESVGLSVATLTGSTPAAERREILRGLAEGSIDIVFGTHALIQDEVAFARLGLAVVDEQHRFGVLQRATLSQEGAHLLVMSATPIPRSLALTVYGDLDISLLDEMPPGRQAVETVLRDEEQLDEVYAELRRRVADGERAYLVFPLVEESETGDLASATQAHAELREGALAGLRLGLLHGRLPAREKAAVSAAFAEGELDAVVATTVVEVGLDVPEATLMIIHQAERFGLAQLHQLRGRVGRGRHRSRCVLVPGPQIGERGRRRLHQLASTQDGFLLAELDLKERGMGDLHGLRQHGELPFKALRPLQDLSVLESSRRRARSILDVDPGLIAERHASLARWLEGLGRRSPLWSAAG